MKLPRFVFFLFAFAAALLAVPCIGGCAAMADAWHAVANAPASAYETAQAGADGASAVLPAFGPWGVIASIALAVVGSALGAIARVKHGQAAKAEAVVAAADSNPKTPPIVKQVPEALATIAEAIVERVARKGGAK